jgi:hypothetical protein
MHQIGQLVNLQRQRQRKAQRVTADLRGLEKGRMGHAFERRVGFPCFQI